MVGVRENQVGVDRRVDGEYRTKGEQTDNQRHRRIQAVDQGQGDPGGKYRQQQGPVASAAPLRAAPVMTLSQQGGGTRLYEAVEHNPKRQKRAYFDVVPAGDGGKKHGQPDDEPDIT